MSSVTTLSTGATSIGERFGSKKNFLGTKFLLRIFNGTGPAYGQKVSKMLKNGEKVSKSTKSTAMGFR